jgi:hypothetical protein
MCLQRRVVCGPYSLQLALREARAVVVHPQPRSAALVQPRDDGAVHMRWCSRPRTARLDIIRVCQIKKRSSSASVTSNFHAF